MRFYASTTIFVLAGLIALLGTTQKVAEVVSQLPLASPFSLWLWEMKVLLMIYIFVYAFFKFTWATWQYNAVAILVGAAPQPAPHSQLRDGFVQRASSVVALAGENFNGGVRAYYLSLAAMSWFPHPLLLTACTTLVVGVLYRREFHSRTLDAFIAG